METPTRRPKRPASPEKAFGQVLRQIRETRSLSQEQLGFDSGYHRTYISLLERGLKSPSLGTIMSLAAALGATATEMMRRVERKLNKER
jgi:transcriptional regulator with XRE-family HTH domain